MTYTNKKKDYTFTQFSQFCDRENPGYKVFPLKKGKHTSLSGFMRTVKIYFEN